MNLAQVKARRQPFASQTDPPGAPASLPGAIRPHIHPHALSRRRLLQLSAGGMAAGAMVGSRLIQPGAAAAKPGPGTPKPIPGGSPVIAGAFGQLYHVYGPGAIDPVDAEPATITDFNGEVGLAYPSGKVTRVNNSTGEVSRLDFNDADVRFMSGVYRGTDGDTHRGTFVFIWIDVFEPGTGSQVNDFNPSPPKPTGLFWTIAAPLGTALSVNPGAGRASLIVPNATVFNYHDIVQSLATGPAAPTATVTFQVEWSGVKSRQNIRNAGDGHAGEFVFTSARMAWTAIAPPYVFTSDPISTSSSSFALLGHERNGVFFS